MWQHFLGMAFLALLSAPAQTQAPKLVIPIGHSDRVTMAKFSPDGKHIATASRDNTVKLWDAETGHLLADLTWEDPQREAGMAEMEISFSGDGSLLLVSDGHIVTLWNALKGKLLVRSNAFHAAFSPDGNSIVMGNAGFKIYRLADFKEQLACRGHDSTIHSIAYSPDGKKILTASEDGTARLWNADKGKLLHTLEGHDGDVYSAKFSPDGTKIVTLCDDSLARIWETNSGKLLFTLAHNDWVTDAAFSFDGNMIVTTSADSTAKAWNAASGNLLFTMKHKKSVNNAGFSPDRKYIATASDDNSCKIWNAATGKPETSLQQNGELDWVTFSPDGKKLVVCSSDHSAGIYDATEFRLLVSLKGKTEPLNNIAFLDGSRSIFIAPANNDPKIWETASPTEPSFFRQLSQGKFLASGDGKKLAIVFNDSSTIWNIETGKAICKVPGSFAAFRRNGSMFVTTSGNKAMVWDTWTADLIKTFEGKMSIPKAAISPDGKQLVTTTSGYNAILRNIATGDTVSVMKHSIFVKQVAFSPTGNRIITVPFGGEAYLWDTAGKLIARLGHGILVASANFSPDGLKIITTNADDNVIKVWNGRSGQLMQQLQGHAYGVTSAYFSGDKKYIISYSKDNTVKIWNAGMGTLLYTFVPIGKDEYLFYEPNGYYMSSPNAAGLLHYVTPNLDVITFDQLDVKYNRPDKVLASTGMADSALISSFRNAYYKRIQKLGIDTSQFSNMYAVPETEILNKQEIAFNQVNRNLNIRLHCSDAKYSLSRLNIWVNEVPLFGIKGIDIAGKNSQSFDTSITITLSQGNNRIETSAINIAGIESYRKPLFVQYAPSNPPKEKVYFIGIGVNRFADASHNLQWSVKDIQDLCVKLRSKYPDLIVDTLFDEKVTRQNILSLKQKLLQLREDDKVIISYSGHGLLSTQMDYYLSTYNINFTDPQENGLAYDELEGLLDNIKPRKKLLLIDACHSGEIDKDEIARIESAKGSLDSMGIKTKSSIHITEKKKLGMTNSFELMQHLFANVGRRTGATVISAAGGMQYAQERGDLKNGVFTYSIIDAFNKNASLTVAELKKLVSEMVTRLTAGLQKPTSRTETNSYNWVVW